MRSIDIFKRAWRSLLSAKTRTILTAFAIAVGAFALTLTLGASNGANNYADIIIRENFNPTELIITKDKNAFRGPDTSTPQVYSPNFGNITSANGFSRQVTMLTDSDIDQLKKVQGVSLVQPTNSVSLQYITRDGQRKYVATATVYDSYRNPALLAGTIPEQLPKQSIILPEGFITVLGFSSAQDAIGKTVRLAVKKQQDQSSLLSNFLTGKSTNTDDLLSNQDATTEEAFTVVAVTKTPTTFLSSATALNLYLNETDIMHLNDYTTEGTSNYHKYLSARVRVADGTNLTKLNLVQERIKKLNYGAQSVLDTEKTITQVISVLQGIVTVFGVIAIIASVFGVINTMYISVLQRTREIGLMKALGMHRKDIYKLFLCEAGLIGFLGGILGTTIGIITGILLNPYISKWLSLGDVSLLDFNYLQLLLLVAALIIVAIIAGLLPARKAATLDPIEALRTE